MPATHACMMSHDPASPDSPPLSPEFIEKLRQTGIRLDRNGRFWHGGTQITDQITHPGLVRALRRWLDVLEDGRSILRLDERRYAYVDVEDAHLLVLSARWQTDPVHGEQAWLSLDDGSEQELDYASLCVSPDHALYCSARSGTLRARVTTPAYYVLAERIVPTAQDDDDHHHQHDSTTDTEFYLLARGRRYPIRPCP